MDEYKFTIANIYESLKGNSREKNGELYIEGFSDEEYGNLYEVLLEELRDFFNGEYYDWYHETVLQYLRFKRAKSKRYDVKYPHERNIFDHSVREQLTVLKFFVYRRYYSYFGKGSNK